MHCKIKSRDEISQSGFALIYKLNADHILLFTLILLETLDDSIVYE